MSALVPSPLGIGSACAILLTAGLGSTAWPSRAAAAQGLEVNGGFETRDSTGWTPWNSPWGAVPVYDYAASDDPAEGEVSFHQSSSSGSFGVYQEFCVEPGVPFVVSWSGKGASQGNGWWEVLVIDAPYSYEAVDDPQNHPETIIATKWETGFGGAEPRAPYPGCGADSTDDGLTACVYPQAGCL